MHRQFCRFSWHLIPILILAIIIIEVQLASPILFLPKNTYAAGIGSPPCKLTIQDTDPSFRDIASDIARRFQIAFVALCPTLVKRFAPRPDVAANVLVMLSSRAPSEAQTDIPGRRITLDSAYLREHPYRAVGTFIGELTYIIQNYTSPDPIWFPEGMAAYVRSIYGPKDDDWILSLTLEPTDSYTQGYGLAARFLHWLQQNTTPTIIDRLNRALQTKQSFSAVFQRLAGGTVDQLWSKYKANPKLGPIKRMPISA